MTNTLWKRNEYGRLHRVHNTADRGTTSKPIVCEDCASLVVQCHTNTSMDKKMIHMIRDLLEASDLTLTKTEKDDCGELNNHYMNVTGDMGRIAMTRLNLRMRGYPIFWEEDFNDPECKPFYISVPC